MVIVCWKLYGVKGDGLIGFKTQESRTKIILIGVTENWKLIIAYWKL
ncbi:hypothetical protein SAMN05216294_2088 [Flagellimonas zhangzhouensis]|uniref:Uncharacterized protein n=1 Tax=Flagellimonas zhangzhouensis TaxID=1073328 RepID=A0A1H2RNQ8_9FLAO|nr:hypothetical protein SAMN05216294_2088 [Allomuricauda zhangzhouensis]SDW20997.1 hypothetical protein SAMN04487892_0736 [Allomuricauda zhangzhouensis]